MFESLLLLVYLSLVSSHWICDLNGGESCVTSPGEETITVGVGGAWISRKTQLTVASEMKCAFACIRISCPLYIYTQDSKCILGVPHKAKALAKVGSARHFKLSKLTNVALMKPTYGSSINQLSYLNKENAVDGVTVGSPEELFSVNNGDLRGWLIVDLESEYVIRAVRIFGSVDYTTANRYQVTIYGGNKLVLDGDFSLYTPLVSIPEKRPNRHSHYVAGIVDTGSYRYVAVKKEFTDSILKLNEFEVYA